MSKPAAYVAFTAPLNPQDAEPVLSRDQVWAGLQRKVRHAEEFVGNAIASTDVLEEKTDELGREVVIRECVFRENNKKVKEVCTFFPQMKVEFLQTDGTRILNTVSDSADGQLYMTYQFEWLMDESTPPETQKENKQKWEKMAHMAVDSSIVAIRKMVEDGRIKS